MLELVEGQLMHHEHLAKHVHLATLALSALFIFMLALVIKRASKAKESGKWAGFESLPGPPNLPLIGALHKFPTLRGVVPFLLKMCTKYGPIWRGRVLWEDIVVLNSPQYAQALLSSTEAGHLSKDPFTVEVILGDIVKGGIIRFPGGESWKSSRKLISRAFSFQALQSYLPLFNKHSIKLVAELEELFSKAHANTFHQINEQIHSCGLASITGAVFGMEALTASEEKDRQLFYEHMTEVRKITVERMCRPYFLFDFIWKLHPMSKKYQRANHALADLIKKMQTSKGNASTGEDTFKSMLRLMQDSGMSEELILDEIISLIISGFETTCATVHYALLLLALHPEHQAACREEVDALFADPGMFADGQLTFDALPAMKYTERCVSETLRLFPPVPGIIRKMETPFKLDEKIEIPAGVIVGISAHVLHNNEEYFPEPDKFEPDRFLPENCSKRHPLAFMPFSHGPRNCIGMKFSMLEVKTMLAHILHNFEVLTSDKVADVPLLPAIVLIPERDYFFRLNKRDQSK